MEVTNDVLNNYTDFLTSKQLMEILQIKKSFLYKLLYTEDDVKKSEKDFFKNKIYAFKCGKNYRILKNEVIKYLKNQ